MRALGLKRPEPPYVCDACGTMGNEDDMIAPGEECPNDDCDGTIRLNKPITVTLTLHLATDGWPDHIEAARMLRGYANLLADDCLPAPGESGPIIDANGFDCGRWEITA